MLEDELQDLVLLGSPHFGHDAVALEELDGRHRDDSEGLCKGLQCRKAQEKHQSTIVEAGHRILSAAAAEDR